MLGLANIRVRSRLALCFRGPPLRWPRWSLSGLSGAAGLYPIHLGSPHQKENQRGESFLPDSCSAEQSQKAKAAARSAAPLAAVVGAESLERPWPRCPRSGDSAAMRRARRTAGISWCRLRAPDHQCHHSLSGSRPVSRRPAAYFGSPSPRHFVLHSRKQGPRGLGGTAYIHDPIVVVEMMPGPQPTGEAEGGDCTCGI